MKMKDITPYSNTLGNFKALTNTVTLLRVKTNNNLCPKEIELTLKEKPSITLSNKLMKTSKLSLGMMKPPKEKPPLVELTLKDLLLMKNLPTLDSYSLTVFPNGLLLTTTTPLISQSKTPKMFMDNHLFVYLLTDRVWINWLQVFYLLRLTSMLQTLKLLL